MLGPVACVWKSGTRLGLALTHELKNLREPVLLTSASVAYLLVYPEQLTEREGLPRYEMGWV